MDKVLIYTDGACKGNPGEGSWAAILIHVKGKKEISGYVPETTNNRMELTAPIMALLTLKKPCEVEIYSDSSYLVDTMTKGWIEKWIRNKWLKGDPKQKDPVKNAELWQILNMLCQTHKVTWNKVKGAFG